MAFCSPCSGIDVYFLLAFVDVHIAPNRCATFVVCLVILIVNFIHLCVRLAVYCVFNAFSTFVLLRLASIVAPHSMNLDDFNRFDLCKNGRCCHSIVIVRVTHWRKCQKIKLKNTTTATGRHVNAVQFAPKMDSKCNGAWNWKQLTSRKKKNCATFIVVKNVSQ